MAIDYELAEKLTSNFEEKSTDELIAIFAKGDKNKYRYEEFMAINKILKKRQKQGEKFEIPYMGRKIAAKPKSDTTIKLHSTKVDRSASRKIFFLGIIIIAVISIYFVIKILPYQNDIKKQKSNSNKSITQTIKMPQSNNLSTQQKENIETQHLSPEGNLGTWRLATSSEKINLAQKMAWSITSETITTTDMYQCVNEVAGDGGLDHMIIAEVAAACAVVLTQ